MFKNKITFIFFTIYLPFYLIYIYGVLNFIHPDYPGYLMFKSQVIDNGVNIYEFLSKLLFYIDFLIFGDNNVVIFPYVVTIFSTFLFYILIGRSPGISSFGIVISILIFFTTLSLIYIRASIPYMVFAYFLINYQHGSKIIFSKLSLIPFFHISGLIPYLILLFHRFIFFVKISVKTLIIFSFCYYSFKHFYHLYFLT